MTSENQNMKSQEFFLSPWAAAAKRIEKKKGRDNKGFKLVKDKWPNENRNQNLRNSNYEI
jgi:hypothetical protein